MVLSATHTTPPEPWIELHVEGVACFVFLARCLTHKCPRHPHRGPLYLALHALEALPSELVPHSGRTYGSILGCMPHYTPPPPPEPQQQRPCNNSPRCSRVYGSVIHPRWPLSTGP